MTPLNVTVPVPGVNVPALVKFPAIAKELFAVVNPPVTDISKFPLIIKPVPMVVVPDETVKLLKEVNIVVGKVLVAVILTVPVPGVQVPAVELLFITNEPAFSIEPEVIVIIPLLAPVIPSIRDEAVSVDPETNVIVPFLLLFPVEPS